MSKEYLEALEELRDFRYGKDKLLVCQTQMYLTIKEALQRLESIDNAKPSEALEIFSKVDNVRLLFTSEERNTIKQALLKAEKYIKRLDAIDNIFEDCTICEIQKEFAKYDKLCEECKCEECALCLGNEICLRRTFERKWELQKAQQPKHYLKWEDLEFDEEEHWLKVKMGDNLYRMDWLIDGLGAKVVSLYRYITKDYLVYCVCIKDNSQQFFNDLRLERVEE